MAVLRNKSPFYRTYALVYSACKQKKGGGAVRKGACVTFEMKWVRDHIEVYRGGKFCFSADSRAEAEREIEEMAA